MLHLLTAARITDASCLLALPLLALLAGAAAADTPYAQLTPVPLTSVQLTDEFWAPRQRTNTAVTLPHEIRMCEETGRLRNFAIAAAREQGQFEGIYFNDSDVFKLLEGASYCYAIERDPDNRAAIAAQIDPIIDVIAAAQQPDGYLNTYYTLVEPDQRWSNLLGMHELYCAGHLIEAGVAHYQATGSRKLLDVVVRYADYIGSVFGPGRNEGVDGHEEIELALVKLAEATGEQRYFRLAQHFVDFRGRSGADYCQDHLPVRQQTEVVGHAVRAMYLYSAVTDLVSRTGDEGLRAAAEQVWYDLTERKMYLTGGVGPSGSNEGFTTAYDLPNDNAYAETCAAIGLALWSKRMLDLHGTAPYADVLERVLYNGFLAGVSLSGDRFFYVNPLGSRGGHHRQPWFGCACCPPNVLRLLPQIGGFLYGTADDSLWVHLYAGSTAAIELSGQTVRVVQETEYPWDGRVRLTVSPEQPRQFELCLRRPGWCDDLRCAVNGLAQPAEPAADGYLHLNRRWSAGDEVVVEFAMPVRRVEAAPMVAADRGRVALTRGPLVYCLEGVDNDGSVRDLFLPRELDLRAEPRPELLGGVTILRGTAKRALPTDWSGELYRTAAGTAPARLIAIPYYAWDNREAGEMVVWLPESPSLTEPRLAPTPADTARVTTSYAHADLGAVNDRILPLSSANTSGRQSDWWDHKGTEEWLAYEFPEPVTVAGVEVFWFDDTGTGECRLPASWVVEWLDGDTWREVTEASPYGRAPNVLNRVTFRPVTTKGLRLRVQLQEGWSAGLCEWRVLAAAR